jgi:hypothetical protein
MNAWYGVLLALQVLEGVKDFLKTLKVIFKGR